MYRSRSLAFLIMYILLRCQQKASPKSNLLNFSEKRASITSGTRVHRHLKALPKADTVGFATTDRSRESLCANKLKYIYLRTREMGEEKPRYMKSLIKIAGQK